MIELKPQAYGAHSLRRTKVALIYKKASNLRARQLLLGHRKLETTRAAPRASIYPNPLKHRKDGLIMDFQGKSVLVVGASSGMGRAISLRFAQEGARVAVTARRGERLLALVEEIEAAGGVALSLPADGADEQGAAEVVSKVIAHWGGIDLVLLNAGGAPALRMTAMTAAEVKSYMRSNYDTVVNYLFPVLDHMKQRNGGMVAHTNSLASFFGVPLAGPYSAAKAAARLLIDTCRIEFEPFGIKFSTLYPGFIATEATKGDGMPSPGEISEEEAVSYMIEAIRREDWDHMFPPEAAGEILQALELPKPVLNEILKEKILYGQGT